MEDNLMRHHHPRLASGMLFSRECSLYYWLGWLSWLLAILGLTTASYLIRTRDILGNYIVESLIVMLSWVITFFIADKMALNIYQRCCQMLHNLALAPVILESRIVDVVRAELKTNPILRWMRPPRSKHIGSQLMSVSLWWQATLSPEGTRHFLRYGEWYIDIFLGYLPLGLTVFILGCFQNQLGTAFACISGSVGLAVLGYSSIRLAGRRQALLDYFSAWREEIPELVTEETVERDTPGEAD